MWKDRTPRPPLVPKMWDRSKNLELNWYALPVYMEEMSEKAKFSNPVVGNISGVGLCHVAS